MCTSSTATPAASEGSLPVGVERNTRGGRSRLPPAASASFPAAATSPRCVAQWEREHVALPELEPRRLPAGALEHPFREVEPDDRGAVGARVDREVTGAAARVERPIAAANGLLHGDAAPPPVEARGHDAV